MHKPSEAEPKVKNMSGTYEPTGTIGIDVGDRLSHFCVLDGKGDVVVEGRVATTKEAMRGYFASLTPSRIALKCGTHSGRISRLASDFGHEVIVANARELRKIHQSNFSSRFIYIRYSVVHCSAILDAAEDNRHMAILCGDENFLPQKIVLLKTF